MKKLKLFYIFLICFMLSGCGNALEETTDNIAASNMITDGFIGEALEYQEEGIFNKVPTYENNVPVIENQKFIKTYYFSYETEDFDKTLYDLKEAVNLESGYIESSNVSGKEPNRYLYITVKIPSKNTDSFLRNTDEIGTVVEQNENTQDVTLSYSDLESRISSYQIEYDRILELLSEAENIDTIILLENRLSEIRYELENYKTSIKIMNNQIEYTSISINITEVKYSNIANETSILSRISTGILNTFHTIGTFLINVFVGVIIYLPYILLISISIFITLFIIKKNKK